MKKMLLLTALTFTSVFAHADLKCNNKMNLIEVKQNSLGQAQIIATEGQSWNVYQNVNNIDSNQKVVTFENSSLSAANGSILIKFKGAGDKDTALTVTTTATQYGYQVGISSGDTKLLDVLAERLDLSKDAVTGAYSASFSNCSGQ